MHREEIARSQRSLHFTQNLWSLSIELASFHSSGIWYFEVAPYTSVNLWTLAANENCGIAVNEYQRRGHILPSALVLPDQNIWRLSGTRIFITGVTEDHT